MILRQRLLIAFMGITTCVLGVYGLMAFYISAEFSAESEIHILKDVAKEKAVPLGKRLHGKTIHQTNTILSEQNLHSRLSSILLGADNNIFSFTARGQVLEFSHLRDYFTKLPGTQNGGRLEHDHGELMWGLATIPDTPYRLVIFHSSENDLSLFQALGVKLLAAAFFIICTSILSTYFIACFISKRFDTQNAVLVHHSLHDTLTDLPNKNLLVDRLQQSLFHSQREGLPVALLLIEFCRIKEITDTLGHRSSDAVIKQIGPRLQKTLRESDTIARLDAGNFAVLLSNVGQENVALIAKKIINSLERPFNVGDLELEVGAFIGIAIFPEHGDDADTLFRQADVAMSLAKKQGRDFVIYTADSDPHHVDKLTLMTDLRQAIGNNELQLYYQPKIDVKTQQVIGAEALIRWFHPLRGLVPPDDFIPKAEQTGLIKPLTKWVIEQALQQGHEWDKQGIPLNIAINVSQRSLYDRELINQIADTMQRLNIKYCSLDIEITETAIMDQPEQSMLTLQELHNMGIHLSIDDFGTGFTSLAYLKELPVDELKIDKSFIMNMLNDGKDIMIVRSIIELAHSLGRVVVAEGVESQEILDLLRTLYCDTAQGFYMSRPLPACDFEHWLKTSAWKHANDQSNTAKILTR